MESKFKDWKARCSSLGHLLTDKKCLTEKQVEELEALQERKDAAEFGDAKPLTANMEEKLAALIEKRDAPDELPQGAKSHLDNVFRSVYWNRSRQLNNKYLDKGNMCEQDSLDLLSDVTGIFHGKNMEYLSNKWIHGTPDNRLGKIKDIKTNFDLDSFDKAELSKLYEWQVKAYMWLDKKTEGELIYCLVNTPAHQLLNEKNSLYYRMGTPDDDEPRHIEARQQLERNMIFDIEKWKEDNPNYIFDNEVLDFDIPKEYRIKIFPVELEPSDIKFIKSRVELAKEYLIEKEKKTNEQIANARNKYNQ